MPGRFGPGRAAVLLVICLAVGGALAVAGCGSGGGSTGAGTASTGGSASTAATGAPTRGLRAANPYVTLSRCESLYERVYASTARRVEELGGPGATPAQRRELRAAEAKHDRALEFCEEELEIDQVRGRRDVNIAATCTEPGSAVDKLRAELAAARLREFDQRRPVVCARIAGGG